MNHLSNLKEAECETCSRTILVSEDPKIDPECENCYQTKLEMIKKEENERQKTANKVSRIWRG